MDHQIELARKPQRMSVRAEDLPVEHHAHLEGERVVYHPPVRRGAEQSFHRGHAEIGQSTRIDQREMPEIRLAVQSKAMHGDAAAYAQAEGRDLSRVRKYPAVM